MLSNKVIVQIRSHKGITLSETYGHSSSSIPTQAISKPPNLSSYRFELTNSDQGLTFCRLSETHPKAALPVGVDANDMMDEVMDAEAGMESLPPEMDSSSSIKGILISMSPLRSGEAMIFVSCL